MEGQVREPQFLRYLVEMGQETFTGAIRLENEDVIKIIYFQDGQIISASTNDPAESVDEILLRGKKVTREHIQQALVKRRQEETLGDALLSAGFITRKELRWARRHQIVEVLRTATAGEGWHYTVVPDYVSPRSAEGTQFQVEPLLIELVVTDPDRKHVDRRLDGGEVRLRKSPSFEDRYPSLGLNQDADRVAELVDGKKTATEIAAGAGGNGFMNLKLLAALRVLGLLEINPKAQEQLEISFEEREAAAGLLPGIEPQPAVEVPQWEIESVGDMELPSQDAAIEWPEAEFGDEPGEELGLGSLGGAAASETTAPAPPASDQEGMSDDSLDLAPLAGESEGALEADDETSPATEEDAEGSEAEVPIQEEVERALEWSPSIEEKQVVIPDESSIDRTDESWLPDEEEIAHAETSQHAAGGSAGGGRGRWIAMVVVALLLVAAATAWYWYRSGEDQPKAAPDMGLQFDGTQEEMSGTPAEGPAVGPEEAIGREEELEPVASPAAGIEMTAENTQLEPGPPGNEPGVRQPAVVTTAGDDPLRAEYDRRARQYADVASSVPYTIQFEIVCQTSSVTLALNEGGSAIWFVPIAYQGRPCFRVFWGRYASEGAARAAVGEIPATLHGSRPVVVQPGRVVE